MADFEIKAKQISSVASQLSSIQKQIKSISSEASSVLKQTRGSITARIGAALQRTVVCNNINKCATDMKNLSQGLNEAVQYYLAYERNVYNKTFGKPVKVKSKSIKNKWEQFKDNLEEKITGFSNAVKKKANEVVNKVKETGKKLWEGTKNLANKTWNFIKDTAGNIKDGFVDAYNYLKDSYNEHGWVYDVLQYGKAAVKVFGGAVMVAAGIVSLAGSGGLSAPASIASIVYGFNDMLNGFTDVANVASDNYDKVDKVDYLKDALTTAGGWVGEKLGNEELGEAIGGGVYNVGKIYVAIANIKEAVTNINQGTASNMDDVFNSMKNYGKNVKTTKDINVISAWKTRTLEYVDVMADTADATTDSVDAIYEFYNDTTSSDANNGFIDWYNKNTKDTAPSEVSKFYKDIKELSDIFRKLK
ncbi:MAG: hypothetical protein IJE48_02860 [Clostridia bacterium]|nr:hypothetical protein [Clostridia bacterium]